MQVGWVKIGDFQQIAGYISKTVQYRCIHFLLKSNRKSYALYRIVTLPGHKIGAIRQDTCDFLLVFRCNYISILYRFWDISTYVPKFSGATWPWMHYRITVCKAILFTFNLQTKFEMSSWGEFGAVLEYSNFRLRISLLIFLRPLVARYGETAIVWPRATCL